MSPTSFCVTATNYLLKLLLYSFASIHNALVLVHAPSLRGRISRFSLALARFTFAMQNRILTLFESVSNMINKLSGQPGSYEKKYGHHFGSYNLR